MGEIGRLIKAVLIDLGETLTHIPPEQKGVIERQRLEETWSALTRLGMNADFEMFSTGFQEISKRTSELCERESIEIPIDEILAGALNRLGFKAVRGGSLAELERAFYRTEIAAWRLFPDSIEALERIKRLPVKVGVVSNSRSDWMVREVTTRLGLAPYFDAVVTSAESRIRKPGTKPFLKALKTLNVRRQETVMVGDTFKTDIVGAKRLGMRAILVLRNSHLVEQDGVRADATVRSLVEAASIIEGWLEAG